MFKQCNETKQGLKRKTRGKKFLVSEGKKLFELQKEGHRSKVNSLQQTEGADTEAGTDLEMMEEYTGALFPLGSLGSLLCLQIKSPS